MSQYVACQPGFKDPASLVKALQAVGFSIDQIEIHTEPQNLYGYHGDKRDQKAHIIIRRKHISGTSNDVGFERKADGTIIAHISEFDLQHYFTNEKLQKLKQEYALDVLVSRQQARGRKVEVQRLVNGEIDVQIKGYR